jgi:hypothetical protein
MLEKTHRNLLLSCTFIDRCDISLLTTVKRQKVLEILEINHNAPPNFVIEKSGNYVAITYKPCSTVDQLKSIAVDSDEWHNIKIFGCFAEIFLAEEKPQFEGYAFNRRTDRYEVSFVSNLVETGRICFQTEDLLEGL